MVSDKKPKMLFSVKEDKYKIRDIGSHDYGRKEIELAHTEMPGLMALREEFGPSQPLKGARVSGSLHMTIQTAVLIETLHHLGADVRWCSCNIFSTQDHAAAAIAKAGTAAVFAWKGMTADEYWESTQSALLWPDGSGPDLLIDDGGDATLMLHEGVRAEAAYEASKILPTATETAHDEENALKRILRRTVQTSPRVWRDAAAKLRGVAEETTTGVVRLKRLQANGELLVPAFNVNDSVTKSKFDNIYGCKHSLTDGIKRATDILLSGKLTVVCGFGDVGKGCAASLKAQGARVVVTEIDPICALQACMEGYTVARLGDVVATADVVVTATGNKGVVTFAHLAAMKNNAVVCNIGHFDNEIEVAALLSSGAVKRTEIKPQVDRFVFADGHGVLVLAEGRLVNLACATGHPSFVMSNSFSNQVLAVLELWRHRGDGKYGKEVYTLPKELDEKVARLHLNHFGAKLERLTEEQSSYAGIPVDGPYKPDSYRY